MLQKFKRNTTTHKNHSKRLTDTKHLFLAHATCPSINVIRRIDTVRLRSESLGREGGRRPEPGIQEEVKRPVLVRELWKDKREGSESGTLLFEISGVEQ